MNEKFPIKQKKLFSNNFSLYLCNAKIEETFEIQIFKNKTAMIVFIVLQLFILVSGFVCLNYGDLTTVDKNELRITKNYGYLSSGLFTVSFILFCFQFKYYNVAKGFLYFNYMSLKMNIFFFHEYTELLLGPSVMEDFEILIISTEFLTLLCYILFFDNNFVRVFLSFILNYTIYAALMIVIYKRSLTNYLINLGGTLIIRLLVYYFWCRSSKESFYYKEKLEIQTNWIYDILNHWNSGVIVYNLSKHRVKLLNNYLKNFDEFHLKLNQNNTDNIIDLHSDNISKTGQNEGTNLLKVGNDNSKEDNLGVLNQFNIFGHLFDVNEDLPEQIRDSFTKQDFPEIIESVNNYYHCESENIFFKEFVFLGHIYLNTENNKGYFEVSMHAFHGNQGYYYELMINDVSKTKKLEEERIKDKTLILGKISHEFKNPLIVVDEVIQQLIENEEEEDGLRTQNKKELINKLFFVKNLCNYMLILVKDFEIVASLENCLKIESANELLEIRPFLKEIGQIIKTLIVKKSARNLFFKLSFDESLDKIYIDSLRLKQILINLLSNSVKFTGIGLIELKVEVLNKSYSNNTSITKEVNGDTSNTNLQLYGNRMNYEDIEMRLHDFKLENNTKNTKQIEDIYLRFSVIDSGKGISDNLINQINLESSVKVFQKDNTQSNNLGTGYGLSIVQKLCTVLNSKLIASHKNDYSPGSMFYFDVHVTQDTMNFNNNNRIEDNKNSNILMEEIALLSNTQCKKDKDFDNSSNNIKNQFNNEPCEEELNNKKPQTLYNKLIFDQFPVEDNIDIKDNNIDNLLKNYSLSSIEIMPLYPFSKEEEIPDFKSRSDNFNFQIGNPFLNIPENNVWRKPDRHQTIKQTFEIKLPNKFLYQNIEKEKEIIEIETNIKNQDNNDDNNNLEIEISNRLLDKKLTKTIVNIVLNIL